MGGGIARVARRFGGVRVETLEWPILYVEFPEGTVEDADLVATLACLEQIGRETVAHRERNFSITDLTRARILPPPRQRKLTSEWMRRTTGLFRAGTLGAVQVTPSALMRGVLTALYWLQEPPSPTRCMATREEAYAHAVAVLDGAKIAVPPEVRAHARGDARRGL